MALSPDQFTQGTLFPGVAPSVTRGARPIPIEPGDDYRKDDRGRPQIKRTHDFGHSWEWAGKKSKADGIQRFRESTAARNETLDSGQLAMFMTPREIHRTWQPLDADREGHWAGHDSWDSRNQWADSDGEWATNAPPHVQAEVESDDELWDRKLDEAKAPRDRYVYSHVKQAGRSTGADTFLERVRQRDSYPQAQTPPSWRDPASAAWSYQDRADEYEVDKLTAFEERKNKSLYDSIAESGVKSPIRLGHQGHGMMGKPEVVGGHHRLAAATDLNPDQFVPVLHHKNIYEAQSAQTQRTYKYS